MKKLIPLLILFIFSCDATNQQVSSNNLNTTDEIEHFTSSMQKQEGFFNFYYDEEAGRIFLVIDKINQEFLYVHSLATGIGSNDIGLDRGQLGGGRVVKFEKHGNKLLLIQPNYNYRAVSENQDEVKSVVEAFASSVLGGFEIKTKNDNAYLIDITDFLLRDSHDVSGRLKRLNQGIFSVDKSRSVIYMDGTFNFPKNTEFESLLTFNGKAEGWWLKSVTPTPDAVTVRTHHSFIELPNENYTPRIFDPRSGFFNISYQDYATPIEEPLVKRYIVRHRLKKKNPDVAISEPIEPIIYYVDRGTPEPIRSTLIEGALWWNQAFEAAGYRNAFQVKVLPEGVHPLDVRYNVIQWVHRSTRGWSYGSGIIDPRTGEMIKGHVSLGSLRVRQDFLIATGLLQPYEKGNETPNEMTEMALARLRQLSAHEVGHTLGLAHNFASSVNDRASVMDYPHPYVKMDEEGNIDLSEVYDDKIGAWDKVTVAYGYKDFPEGENEKKLTTILDEAFDNNLRYITDQDARPAGGLHPEAHLWDNGTNAATELNRMIKIRRKILNRFSEKTIRENMPMSSIEEALVPMYLFHRYQIEATAKLIGGLNYSYALRGSDQVVTEMISTEEQMTALEALLQTVEVNHLKLPELLLKKIPPRAFGYPRSRETFQSKTGPAFDYLAAVETAVNVPFSYIFNVDRFNRLLTHKARNANQPGVDRVLDEVVRAIWMEPSTTSMERTIERVVEMEMLKHLMGLAVNDQAYDEVRARAFAKIKEIKFYIVAHTGRKTNNDGVYYQYVVDKIDAFLDDPEEFKVPDMIKAPDGSPIGRCDF